MLLARRYAMACLSEALILLEDLMRGRYVITKINMGIIQNMKCA